MVPVTNPLSWLNDLIELAIYYYYVGFKESKIMKYFWDLYFKKGSVHRNTARNRIIFPKRQHSP